jgi:hypothetical protein
MRWLRGGVALAAATLLAGCGSQQQAMDPQVRAQLHTTTGQLSAAARQQDRPAAETALQKLFSEVAAAQAAGKLSAADAQPILTAASRVAQDVQTIQPPAPVTVTVAPPTSDQNQDQYQQGRGRDGRRHGGNN